MTSENVASLAKQVGLRVSDDGALWGHARALESFARQTIDPYQAEVHLLRAQRNVLRAAAKLGLQAMECAWGREPAGALERDAMTALRTAIDKVEGKE